MADSAGRNSSAALLFSWFPTTLPTILFVGLCGAFGLLLTIGFVDIIGAGVTGQEAPLWETFIWGFVAVSGLFAGFGVLVTAVVVGYRYTGWAGPMERDFTGDLLVTKRA